MHAQARLRPSAAPVRGMASLVRVALSARVSVAGATAGARAVAAPYGVLAQRRSFAAAAAAAAASRPKKASGWALINSEEGMSACDDLLGTRR